MVRTKHHLTVFPLAGLLLIPSAACHAQQSKILKYNLETAPKSILVTKGTLIEFSGPVNRAGDQNYYLQCAGQVVDSGAFRDYWTLHLDTRALRTAYATVTLHVGTPGGSSALLARLHVSCVEGVPFVLSQVYPDAKPVDTMQMRIVSTDRKPQKVSLTLDRKPFPVARDAADTLSFEPTEELLGAHTLGGKVITDDEQVFELDPIKVNIVGKVRLLPFPSGDTLDLAAVNGSIPLRFQSAPGVHIASVSYLMDGQVIASQQETPFQCRWNPRNVSSGAHRLRVEVVDKDGKHSTSTLYPFSVTRSSPKMPPAILPKTGGTEASPAPVKYPIRLVVPSDPKRLLEPVTLAVQSDAPTKIKSVQYSVNGSPLVPDPADPLTAFWDTRSEWPGGYEVAAVVTMEGGETCKIAAYVRIPVRVSALPISGKVLVSDTSKTLPLGAAFLDGLTPKAVDFQIDGAQVAVCYKAPFDAAAVDVSDLNTGAHNLIVHVTDEQGARYVSPILTFDVVNKPMEVALKKAEDAIKAEIEQNKHVAEYLRRKNIVGNALGSTQRSGSIGRVNGLAVVTINGESVFGTTLTVDGAVSVGTGRVTLLADAAADTQIAAEVAAAYCKSKILQLGFSVDWTQMDLTLNYPGSLRIGGDSAGVADTLVLISACLKKPIDSSVAVTGAINLQGGVDPVGGVMFKAERALSDPAIHTLIIPSHYINETAVDALYIISPELFLNKRVILASNMDQVLRQSIIGYDKTYDRAEALIQTGIQAFLAGKDTVAISAFTQASRLTPENATIYAWIAAVRNGKKQ